MTCPECGESNPDGAGQCAACGSILSAPTRAPTQARATFDGAKRPTSLPSGTSSTNLVPGDSIGPRYEILAVLGEGGMGTVFKARDRELDRTVALKVIRPEMVAQPGMLERFKREILLASQVTHKNVVRVHDIGETGDLRYISMHYVDGSDLKTLLRRDGALPVDRALPIVRQIGDALRAAHEAGVVHRDLKPQNILIDAAGNAYIADFGISRSLDSGGTMTEAGSVLGTIDYMSPEQARGDKTDNRSDIFAFGVMLFEIFSGTLPFKGGDTFAVMMKRVHQEAPPLIAAGARVPAWIAAIVARALRRDPRERYQGVGDLLRDLERRKASVDWRRALVRRVPMVAGAGLLIAALVAGGVYLRKAWQPAAIGAHASLAILPIQNATGDRAYEWARAGVPSLLRADLVQARGLRLVGEDRVRQVLESLKIGDEDPRPATIRRVGVLTGADRVLTARLMKIANRLRIEASLSEAASETASAPALVVEGEGDKAIFGMIDELTRRIKDVMGVSSGLMERPRKAAELSTGSVAALASWGDALASTREGREMDAAICLEDALEKDPGFSVARALLAETYDRLGQRDKAVAEAEQAAGGLASASPYEAARIRGTLARLKGDLAKAEEAYKSLCEIAPNDTEAFLNLARIQRDRGELEGARDSLRHVIELDPKHAAALFSLGQVQFLMGNPDLSVQSFNAALALHEETGNDEGKATVLNGIGVVDFNGGNYAAALKHYQASLEIRRKIGDRKGVGVSLINIASTYGRLGKDQDAIRSAMEAIAVARELGDKETLANDHDELGDIYDRAGRPEEALAAYRESLKILLEIKNPAKLARTQGNIGYISSVLGRYAEASFALNESLAKHRELGGKTEILRALIDVGLVEQVQGKFEEALGHYTEGLALGKEINDRTGIILLLENLSTVHGEQGNYGTGLSLMADAEKLAREAKDNTSLSWGLVYQGRMRASVGDFEGAESSLAEGLRLARETGQSPLVAEALVNQAALALARGDRRRATAVSRDAVAAATAARDTRLLLLARLRAGEAGRSARDLEKVVKESQEAGLAPIAAAARLSLGEIHLEAGRPDEAVRQADQAAEAARTMGQRDLLFRAHLLAGMSLKKRRNPAGAAERFSAALESLEEMRLGLKEPLSKPFLERPETSLMRNEATEAFQASGRESEAARLRRALQP